MWSPDDIQQGHLHALRDAAESAWADDTRDEHFQGHPQRCAGQCYATSKWLTSHLGGEVGRVGGHYIWLSPTRSHGVDLTGDTMAFRPKDSRVEGFRADEEDPGVVLDEYHKTYHPGPVLYKSLDHPHFQGWQALPEWSQESPDWADRVGRFSQRANLALTDPGLLKTAEDLAGDAFPAEEPQRSTDIAQQRDMQSPYWHAEPDYEPGSGTYNFVYGNGQLHVDPEFGHDELAGHMDIAQDHTGPFATGHVTVTRGKATWQIAGNVSPRAIVPILEEYSKHIGWAWGGATDISGQPINDDFAPKSAMYYAYDDHLYISTSAWPLRKKGSYVAKLPVQGRRVYLTHTPKPEALEALLEWATDQGFTLVGRSDNVIKNIEDMQTHNTYSPTMNEWEQEDWGNEPNKPDVRGRGGVYTCPDCQRLLPSWDAYVKHRLTEEPMGDSEPLQEGHFPEVGDGDQPLRPRFMDQETPMVNTGSVREAERVDGYRPLPGYGDAFDHKYLVAYRDGSPLGFLQYSQDERSGLAVHQAHAVEPGIIDHLAAMVRCRYKEARSFVPLPGFLRFGKTLYKWAKDPKDLLDAPVPFIYDVDKDEVIVGHPGTRHSDIEGKFTPGGIIEGTYEPGGKVIIRSMTNMPYTVRHLLELWYYQYPHMEIKSVHLRDDSGKDTRLAHALAYDAGGYVGAFVQADPVASQAAKALRDEGGRVLVVGGAVRDAVLGHEPEDVDLMVAGLPADRVRRALEAVGRVDLTGKDFGVFRYKRRGHSGDVEISLPRRERSIGPGHKGFDVQANHLMEPEDDLYRRDFSVNAMAIDLENGELLDPFGGIDDIAKMSFRTLYDDSLTDDPLRILRGLVLFARFGLKPDAKTARAMSDHAEALRELPGERIQRELDKLIASPWPATAIRLAHDLGVLKHFLPEVESAFDYDQQNPHHAHDLGTHLLIVLRETAKLTEDPDVRLAALLHDIGKPVSAWWHPEDKRQKYYFHLAQRDLVGEAPDGAPLTVKEGMTVGLDHWVEGASMASHRLRELRYSEERIERIASLIRFHMFPSFRTTKAARRFLNRVGSHADDLMILRTADMGGKGVDQSHRAPVDTQQELIDRVRNERQATKTADLVVDGNDIMAELDIKPSPRVGKVLSHLVEVVLEDPSANDRDTLLRIARSVRDEDLREPPEQDPRLS